MVDVDIITSKIDPGPDIEASEAGIGQWIEAGYEIATSGLLPHVCRSLPIRDLREEGRQLGAGLLGGGTLRRGWVDGHTDAGEPV
jgi:hypothetical protein